MRVNYAIVFVQEPKEIFGAQLAQYVAPDGLAISIGEERGGG